MSDKKIIVVGYSGHGFVVADAAIASGMNLCSYSEEDAKTINPFGLDYVGNESKDSFSGWTDGYDFILGIGNNTIRQKIAQLILSKQQNILNVIHPSASLAPHISIGSGNFISRNVSINILAKIADFCILNTGCIIEHDCNLGNAVHIAPGAVLAGNVTIGDRSFIGANAVIKQGVTIGKDVVIGAGSVVIKDIPDNKKVAGNPSKEI